MENKLRDAVYSNAIKQIKQSQEERKRAFQEKYNKTKKIEFLSEENINMNKHFYFPKMIGIIEISKAALAVYPVLCAHADFETKKWFQLSRENIAVMAGINTNSVDKAIKELCKIRLEDEPLLERKMVNDGSRRFYNYRIAFIRKNMFETWKNQYFSFYNCIIDSGIWSELKPRAKALYLTLRQYSQFDFDLYCDIEHLCICESEFDWKKDYRERKWDVCLLSLAALCRYADIEASNIKVVFKQLEKHRLVDRIDEFFTVYLKPKIRKTR